MKILMTGYTAHACASQRRKRDYSNSFDQLEMALELMGHTVFRDEVRIGDPLPYDLAFIQVCDPAIRPTLALRKYGALFAASRIPSILFIDDGEVYRTVSSQKNAGHAADVPALIAAKKPWMEALGETWSRGHARWMLPMYTWGDKSKLGAQMSDAIYWDPSPFEVTPKPTMPFDAAKRQRSWICAATQRRTWYDTFPTTWAKNRYGNADILRSWPVVREHVLVDDTSRCWGMLMHPYYHAGSGWCKLRYRIAMNAGVVFGCESNEFPKDFPWKCVPEVEQMTIEQLMQLRTAQAKWVRDHEASLDESVEQLKKVLHV